MIYSEIVAKFLELEPNHIKKGDKEYISEYAVVPGTIFCFHLELETITDQQNLTQIIQYLCGLRNTVIAASFDSFTKQWTIAFDDCFYPDLGESFGLALAEAYCLFREENPAPIELKDLISLVAG